MEDIFILGYSFFMANIIGIFIVFSIEKFKFSLVGFLFFLACILAFIFISTFVFVFNFQYILKVI